MWSRPGGAGTHAEAEHDGVGVVVRQGAKAVELFLASSVPETEFDGLVVHVNVVDVVLEDGGLVDDREVSPGEDVEQGRLAARAIAEQHDLAGQGPRASDGEARHHDKRDGANERWGGAEKREVRWGRVGLTWPLGAEFGWAEAINKQRPFNDHVMLCHSFTACKNPKHPAKKTALALR